MKDEILKYVEYDAETGLFTWLTTSGKARVGNIAGSVQKTGYVQIGFHGNRYYAHRLAWRMHHGEWPIKKIDHINGIKTDNRISNLRLADDAENAQNIRSAHSDNKTGYLGVMKGRSRFYSQICAEGKKKTLGHFDTPEEAHQAYVKAKRDAHATCSI